MKGSETKLVSYMQGSDKRFVIPVYQRNYDWKQENCKQLYDDLVKIIRNERKAHFFGSIVSVHSDSEYNEFLVIDGQQRLTTISLLMLAMVNLIRADAIKPAQANLADKILKTYLVDEWQEDETRIKLKPVKNDSNAFRMLFQEEEDHIAESNLTLNYAFFYNRIQKEEITIDQLYTAITRLEIINITLNHEDNPQLIFESLNSTGLALSEGDKIRNFILMGLPSKDQNEYYEKYWNRIEVLTGYDISAFIRDYLSVKLQAIPTQSKVYLTFKAYVEDNELSTELLLKDMLSYAKRYAILLKGKTADAPLNACIYRLNRLETTVTRPFFLEVLRLNDENTLTLPAVRDIFLYTENYLFRRFICDMPTNALNKIFLMLHREIIRFDGTSENYTEKFKYALLSRNEKGRFPCDIEFAEAIVTRQVYPMNSKNKIYLFERLENAGTIEDKDIYHHCDEGTYSIEHIMPQHLTPAWVEELGAGYEEIHASWLHRLANLTLTGYNSKYSNNPFEDKKTMENGFIQSGLRMNTWIAQQSRWTLQELEERSKQLAKKALEIWSLPETTYCPEKKQYDTYTLGDDADLSGREIVRYEYLNTVQPVPSWIAMMEQIMSQLHANDKSIFTKLAHTDAAENEIAAYLSDEPTKLRSPAKLDEGIYFERNTSTTTKLSILQKAFKAFDLDPETLVFYLKDACEQAQEDDAGSRYELRRRYWAFALDFIHESHKETGCFSKVNPSKENWIAGYFGLSGFQLCCLANYDHARIELTLTKSDKQQNKAAFDFLLAQKVQIEQSIGVQLEWNRSDDTKASYVSYRLPNVSITNETDWTQIAKFHAEWSKKFYEVFVPLLKQWQV